MEDTSMGWVEGTWPKVLHIIIVWWENLQKPVKRGDKAELRRARNADDVAMLGTYYAVLAEIMKIENLGALKNLILYRLPAVIGLLSHVKSNNTGASVSDAMRTKKKGSDQALVSDLRFRRILRLEHGDELYTTMIRVIRMLEGSVNVKDFATSIFFWNERTRKKWASNYYLKRDIY